MGIIARSRTSSFFKGLCNAQIQTLITENICLYKVIIYKRQYNELFVGRKIRESLFSKQIYITILTLRNTYRETPGIQLTFIVLNFFYNLCSI